MKISEVTGKYRQTHTQLHKARAQGCEFVVLMHPMDFLKLTCPDKDFIEYYVKNTAAKLLDYNKWAKAGDWASGKPIDYSATNMIDDHPFLWIRLKSDGTAKVVEHEGRHRAAAVLAKNGKEYPVAIRIVSSTHKTVKNCSLPEVVLNQFDSYEFPSVSTKDWKIQQSLDAVPEPIYPKLKKNKVSESRIIKLANAGHDIIIYENPSFIELLSIFANKKVNEFRGIIDLLTKKIYVWNSYDALHSEIALYLDLSYNRINFFITNSLADVLDDPSYLKDAHVSYDSRMHLYIGVHNKNTLDTILTLPMFNRMARPKIPVSEAKVIKTSKGLVYQNPSYRDIVIYINKFGALRGLIDKSTSDVFIWPAINGIHYMVANSLGIYKNDEYDTFVVVHKDKVQEEKRDGYLDIKFPIENEYILFLNSDFGLTKQSVLSNPKFSRMITHNTPVKVNEAKIIKSNGRILYLNPSYSDINALLSTNKREFHELRGIYVIGSNDLYVWYATEGYHAGIASEFSLPWDNAIYFIITGKEGYTTSDMSYIISSNSVHISSKDNRFHVYSLLENGVTPELLTNNDKFQRMLGYNIRTKIKEAKIIKLEVNHNEIVVYENAGKSELSLLLDRFKEMRGVAMIVNNKLVNYSWNSSDGTHMGVVYQMNKMIRGIITYIITKNGTTPSSDIAYSNNVNFSSGIELWFPLFLNDEKIKDFCNEPLSKFSFGTALTKQKQSIHEHSLPLTQDKIESSSRYWANRIFASEQEARDTLFGKLEHEDQQSYSAFFGKNGTEVNKKIAYELMPIYKIRNKYKIGVKLKPQKKVFSWNDVTIVPNTLEYITTAGYVNTFDVQKLNKVQLYKIRSLNPTELHTKTDTGIQHVNEIYYNILNSDDPKFKAILIDQYYNILDGHHRLEVARKLKMKDIPANMVVLDE